MSDKENYFPPSTDINAINETLYTDYQTEIIEDEADNDNNKDFIDYFDEPPF